MSGRLLSGRLAPKARQYIQSQTRLIHHHTISATGGGLLRSDIAVRSLRRKVWPMGHNFVHNSVAVRNASFARILPQIMVKFARIPAMFGGAIIAGLAYVQYQATRKNSNHIELDDL